MSLCDRCTDPGMCCRSIVLNNEPPAGLTRLEVLVWISTVQPCQGELGLPFIPEHQGPPRWSDDKLVLQCPFFWQWRYSCPVLTAEGRCGDHDHRPKLCRDFTAGEHQPCIMTPPTA